MLYLLLSMLLLPSLAAAVINVRMQTDLGVVDIVLRDDVAPLTVENFLDYANRVPMTAPIFTGIFQGL